MGHQNVYQLISTEFGKSGIPFLLVGGFAVNYYKVSRSTGDVDLLMREEDYPQALRILEKAGYREFRKEFLCARLKSEELFFMPVDILFTDPASLAEMLKEAKEVEIRGQQFKVPSLQHLMAMKLHSLRQSGGDRDYKDLLDLLDLMKQNQIDGRSQTFKDLCLKFGGEEIYKKIEQFLP